MQPIGVVRNEVPEDEVSRQRATMVSDIIIDDEWADALTGIEEYSHIFVLFWMHKKPDTPVQQLIHPRGNEAYPLSGVLATRVRNRPNQIGMAVAELIRREGNKLTVMRLDAYNGTPILDLKPYDDYDVVESVKVPQWWAKKCRK